MTDLSLQLPAQSPTRYSNSFAPRPNQIVQSKRETLERFRWERRRLTRCVREHLGDAPMPSSAEP